MTEVGLVLIIIHFGIMLLIVCADPPAPPRNHN